MAGPNDNEDRERSGSDASTQSGGSTSGVDLARVAPSMWTGPVFLFRRKGATSSQVNPKNNSVPESFELKKLR